MSKYRRRLAMIRQYYEDFQEVEYIENTSNAYIDTGIKTNSNINIEAQFSISQFLEDKGQFLLGSRTSTSLNKFIVLISQGQDKITWHYNNSNLTATVSLGEINTKWTISNNKGVLTYSNDTNSYTLTISNGTFSNNLNMLIFCMNNNGSVPTANAMIGRYYYFKIYDGTTLVRDFVPVKQRSSNKFGLWDRVEGKFYVSPNGTDFVGGADVVRDINDNIYYLKEYVGARGYYSYVDTGIKGNSTDVIKVSVMTTSRPSTGWCWLIGYQTSESNRFGIYHRGSDNKYRFIVDFWRGNSGNSRKYSDVYPNLNQRYDLVVGNDTLNTTNKGFMYDERSNVFIFPKYQSINTTSSNDTYCVSEYRAQKANYYNRYYNIEIYKEINNKKVLVLHYIPTQRVEDGVYGFFDTVTKTFHPSQGDQKFTGG